jgi:8-amino-3,8-dideoxy-alpha-D-manno-octulosonate transaminase
MIYQQENIMNTHRDRTPIKKRRISRRSFLGATSVATLSFSIKRRRAYGQSSSKQAAINPGFFAPQYYDSQEEEALRDVLDAGAPFRYYGQGQPVKVDSFETEFARYMGAKFALGVTSGTAALDCAMIAIGIGPGDEVIIPAYTWWSDYTCVIHAGALPVFADIDESICLDPIDFERKITPRTKAVIPVHLLGGTSRS